MRPREDDLAYLVVRDEIVHDDRIFSRGDQDVEVADGFPAPTKTAGGGDVFYTPGLLQVVKQCGGDVFCGDQFCALRCVAKTLHALHHQLLGFFSEAVQFANPAAAGGAFEVVQTTYLQFFIECSYALGPEALDFQQVAERSRYARLDVLEQWQSAGCDDSLDLFGQVLADAGKLGQIFSLFEQIGHALWFAAQRACGVAVGTHPERIGAVDFEQVGEPVEHIRYFSVMHRHLSPPVAQ